MKTASYRPRARLVTVISLLLAASLALASCSGGSDSSESAVSSKNTVVVAVSALASKWGSPDSGLENVIPVTVNTRATLVRKKYVSTGADTVPAQDLYEFEPYLAESYDISGDGLTITFHLRTDVKSAAGNPLTADDVIWSFKRKFGAPDGQSQGLYKPAVTSPDQFQKIDEHTVTLTLKKPSDKLLVLALLSDYTGPIYDSVLLSQHTTPDDPYALKWSDTNPDFGFGPYRISNYVSGQSIDLTKNPNFPAALSEGTENVRLRVVGDAATRLNSLKSGNVDIATDLLPHDLSDLSGVPDITVPKTAKSNAWLMMAMTSTLKPFDNLQVRQAMSYAIPYDDIIKEVYYTRATRGTGGLLDPDAPGYTNANLTVYTYDPEKAKTLLRDAGYPDGLSFTLTVDSAVPDLEAAAIRMKTAAAKAGIDITIRKVTDAVFWQGRGDHSLQAFLTRDYAITLVPSYELNLYTQPDSNNNLGNWTSAQFEQLTMAAQEEPDPLSDAAGVKWSLAEKMLIDEAPMNFITQVQPALAYRTNISGFAWRTDQNLDFSSITKN